MSSCSPQSTRMPLRRPLHPHFAIKGAITSHNAFLNPPPTTPRPPPSLLRRHLPSTTSPLHSNPPRPPLLPHTLLPKTTRNTSLPSPLPPFLENRKLHATRKHLRSKSPNASRNLHAAWLQRRYHSRTSTHERNSYKWLLCAV